MRERLLDVFTATLLGMAALIGGLELLDRFGAKSAPLTPTQVAEASLSGWYPTASDSSDDSASLAKELNDIARPAVILVYRSECPACNLVRPTWESMIAELGVDAAFYALATRATATPFWSAPLVESGAVELRLFDDAIGLTRFMPTPAVPTTLLLLPDHSVPYVRVGPLSAEDRTKIKAILARARK
jgi:hypothetical protein